MKKILITGASGFLGSRLTECLLRSSSVSVRAMAHSPAGASPLARMKVDIVWCDITDPEQVQKAMDGCDAVVHCAYGASGNASVNREVTVKGTSVLAEAAVAAGVEVFVHVSSVAVYSYSPACGITEQSPLTPGIDYYCRDKADAERALLSVTRRTGLPAVILRMGNIYGPFSGPWTIRPLAHIKRGITTLIDGGEHASNMVFVDNAIEAILLSLKKRDATGEAFFVTDDEISWRQFYGSYADWLGGAKLRTMSSDKLHCILHPSFSQKVTDFKREIGPELIMPIFRFAAFRAAKTPCLANLATRLWGYVPIKWKRPILGPEKDGSPCIPAPRGNGGEPGDAPLGLLQVYAGRAVFSNSKAKKILGYGPQADHAKALEITKAWANWARLI